MSEALSASAQRVQSFLELHGTDFRVHELDDSARTAQAAADALGCSVAQIAKSLVFKDPDSEEPILIIASGRHQVDLKKIEAASGLTLGRADGRWVKKTSDLL